MGRTAKHEVNLTEEERNDLLEMVSRGEHNARELRRARTLLRLDEDELSRREVANLLDVCSDTIVRTARRFGEGRLEAALFDRRRSGRPPKIGPKEEATITAIACSDPPEGRARWTLTLIRDELIVLSDQIDSLTAETVRVVLKKTRSSPGSASSGC